MNFVVVINNFILTKNAFKVAFQYHFIIAILLNTVVYLKLYFKLKIHPKTCSYKNLISF